LSISFVSRGEGREGEGEGRGGRVNEVERKIEVVGKERVRVREVRRVRVARVVRVGR
jgi:hypothetical protein